MSFFLSALERAEQDLARRRQAAASELASEVNPVSSVESRKGLEQLKLLFAYSKFDIGLYTAVAMTFTGAIAFEPAVLRFHRGLLGLAVFFTCLAGMAAGIVARHCPHFVSWSDLWEAKIGPFRWRCLKGEYWAYLQHTCFGIALVAAVLSVLSGCTKWLFRAGCIP
jgi:hypothetical protein